MLHRRKHATSGEGGLRAASRHPRAWPFPAPCNQRQRPIWRVRNMATQSVSHITKSPQLCAHKINCTVFGARKATARPRYRESANCLGQASGTQLPHKAVDVALKSTHTAPSPHKPNPMSDPRLLRHTGTDIQKPVQDCLAVRPLQKTRTVGTHVHLSPIVTARADEIAHPTPRNAPHHMVNCLKGQADDRRANVSSITQWPATGGMFTTTHVRQGD